MKDKYLTYDPISLASDDSFIKWVQAGSSPESEWGRWVVGNPEFQRTINEASALVSVIQFKEENVSDKADAIWNRINSTIEEDAEIKVIKMPRRNMFRLVAYAAAACAAVLLVSQVLLKSDISISAQYGESIAHVLPDDSKVRLNAGSSIKYDKNTWSDNRSLSLDGEAYFEVEEGKKFSVQTAKGVISVLGTSFNIYSRDDGFKVHCTSGKVAVVSGNDKVILTPNTQTHLTDKGLDKTIVAEGIEVSWLNKIYKFESLTLQVVFESIERQFDVNILADKSTKERLYTGSYDAVELDKALKIVCFPMELTYNIQGNKVTIDPDEGN